MIKIELKRIALKDTYTIGRLYINGKYFCDTLEDKVRILKDKNKDGDFDDAGEGKIWGRTAIPAGKYSIDLTYSNRFDKILPILEDVPGYAGVRIHSGNTSKDTNGCILVGTNNKVGMVTDSRVAFKKLMVILEDAHDNKETILIIIT